MCSTDLSSALKLQEHWDSEFENSFHVCVVINRKFDKREMIQYNVKEWTHFETTSKKKEFYW